MRIAYNPLYKPDGKTPVGALTSAPTNDITFDLPGRAIFAKGVRFNGRDHTYSFTGDQYIKITPTIKADDLTDVKIDLDIAKIIGGAVTVYLDITSDANYPIVWTSENNTKNTPSQLLHKSYLDLYYNPKAKALYTTSYHALDGYYKQGSDNNHLLLGAGGHIDITKTINSNSTDSQIPTAKAVLSAYIAMYTSFTGGTISSNGNILTLLDHSLTLGGITKSTGASTATIINSNKLGIGSSANIMTIKGSVNDVAAVGDTSLSATIINTNKLGVGSSGNILTLKGSVNGIVAVADTSLSANIINSNKLGIGTSGNIITIKGAVNGVTAAADTALSASIILANKLGISSSGNLMTIKGSVNGINATADTALTANIINSLSVSKASSSNNTNLTLGITVNGIASADKTIADLYAATIRVKDVRSAVRNTSFWEDHTVNFWFNESGTPTSAWYSGITVKGWTNGYQTWELASGSTTSLNGNLYYRNGINSAWQSWQRIVFASELPGLFTQFAMNGNATRITVGGTTRDLTIGYANVAGQLANARTISLTKSASGSASFNGTANISIATTVLRLDENSSTTASDPGGLTWFNISGTAGAAVNVNDTPTSAWWYILRNRHTNTGNNYYTDVAIPFNDTSIYYKIVRNNSLPTAPYNKWIKVLDINNWTTAVNWTDLPGKVVAGNEFNIVNAGYNSTLWFNYLPINNRSSSATISSYHMGNGNKGYATITAAGFYKNGYNDNYALLAGGGVKQWTTSNTANALVARDGNGYVYAGYYNTAIGNEDSMTINHVYCSNDTWIRRASISRFRTVIASGLYWANVAVSLSPNTGTLPTVNTIYASNWFRSTGSTGWYSESYGGGWYMSDTSWIRAYNSKGVYTGGSMYASGYVRSDTRIFTGYDSGQTNSVSCSNWFRSSGTTGWYNASYGDHVYSTGSYILISGHMAYTPNRILSTPAASSWIDGQRYNNAAYNVNNMTDTGSYWPWMRGTNTGSGRWFSVGVLNTSYYIMGSTTSRTANGYDYCWRFDVSNGWAYGNYQNSDTCDGLHVHGGRNNEANKIVRTDGNGYILAGWINTTSGNMGATAMDRIYCSNDGYIRYKTLAQFKSDLGAMPPAAHTHTTTIAASSATNQITLAFGTKYALTAGGTSYIFTMPANPNTSTSSIPKYIDLYEPRGSTTNLNKTTNYVKAGATFHLVATGSTTTGKPPTDACILQMNWDAANWDTLLGVSASTGATRLYFRNLASGSWQGWREAAHIVANTSVGNGTRPVYVASNGAVTASSSTVGATYEPVYMSGGTITSATTAKSGTISVAGLAQSISSVTTTPSSNYGIYLGGSYAKLYGPVCHVHLVVSSNTTRGNYGGSYQNRSGWNRSTSTPWNYENSNARIAYVSGISRPNNAIICNVMTCTSDNDEHGITYCLNSYGYVYVLDIYYNGGYNPPVSVVDFVYIV